jgi:transcriptional regulator with XRE-family HTH domain
MNSRIREIRKKLGYTQKEFAEALGITQSGASWIEKDGSNVSDAIQKSICREFNVDYMWLTTGVGEMFSDSDNDYTALIDRVMVGENEFAKNVFKMFSKFNEEDWEALQHMISIYSDIAKKPRF